MPLEIEIKLRVETFSDLRTRLGEAGGKYLRRQIEVNTFLDQPDHSLYRSGASLRIRTARDLDTAEMRVVITHKGPRQAGAIKIRPETELRVESYDRAVELLQELGFQITLSFEKRRETWDLGECEVVLDELPADLGRYVEIEGPDESQVSHCRAQLGLLDAPSEDRAYAAIIGQHLASSRSQSLAFAE